MNKPPDTSGPRTADNLTPKQEAFAQAYIATGEATAAYKQAYNCDDMQPQSINRTSWELMQHPGITSRIAQLRQDKAPVCTVESLVLELESDRKLSNSLDKPSAQFSLGKGKLMGFLDNKQTSAEGVLVALSGLVAQLDKRNEPPPMPEPPAISSTCERIEE